MKVNSINVKQQSIRNNNKNNNKMNCINNRIGILNVLNV